MLDVKVNSIVLIDDSHTDNLLNEQVIYKANLAHEVIVFDNAEESIDWLQTSDDFGGYPQPALILLDINMPWMNGWDFLDAFEDLPAYQKQNIVIVMLTNSLNQTDWERAQASGLVTGFMTKPLTIEALHKVILTTFEFF